MNVIDDLVNQGWVISIIKTDTRGICILASKGDNTTKKPDGQQMSVYGDTFKKAIENLNLKILGY